jgi:hypothetical protein
LWRNWWNEDWQGKPKYSEKTCPQRVITVATKRKRSRGRMKKERIKERRKETRKERTK